MDIIKNSGSNVLTIMATLLYIYFSYPKQNVVTCGYKDLMHFYRQKQSKASMLLGKQQYISFP